LPILRTTQRVSFSPSRVSWRSLSCARVGYQERVRGDPRGRRGSKPSSEPAQPTGPARCGSPTPPPACPRSGKNVDMRYYCLKVIIYSLKVKTVPSWRVLLNVLSTCPPFYRFGGNSARGAGGNFCRGSARDLFLSRFRSVPI